MKNEQNIINYFLALEKRPGDFAIIDIERLNLGQFDSNHSISCIDSFTRQYSEAELKNAIQNSNIVPEDYLRGELKVVSNAKHPHSLPVLTNDKFDTITNFFENCGEIDQRLKDRLYNAYKKVLDKNFDDYGFIATMLTKFRTDLKRNDVNAIFRTIQMLPYDKSRMMYFIINDETKSNELNATKRLEKLNDNK